MLISFERARADALDRLSRPATPTLAIAGALSVAGLVLGVLVGFPAGVVPVLVFEAAAVATLLPAEKGRRKLCGALEAATKPDLWFHSDAAGLFFLDERGVFVESRRRHFDWAHDDTSPSYLEWLESISYEETGHALKLQLAKRVDRNANEQRESLMVPLPQDVTPDAALKLAVEANRRVARGV